MIENEKWYTLSDLVKEAELSYVPFKGKNSWMQFIRSGKLKAIKKGTEKRFTYLVRGSDVIKFVDELYKSQISTNQQ